MTNIKPFVLKREFLAPRALLWKVRTQADHLQHWLIPTGFHSIHSEMHFREAGRYFYCIQAPNDMQKWGVQQFVEIVPKKRIVYLQSFSNMEGGLSRHPMAPSWPSYMQVTAMYEDSYSGNVTYTISCVPHDSDEVGIATFDGARSAMQTGFEVSFAKLDAYLHELQVN